MIDQNISDVNHLDGIPLKQAPSKVLDYITTGDIETSLLISESYRYEICQYLERHQSQEYTHDQIRFF